MMMMMNDNYRCVNRATNRGICERLE